MDSCHPCRSALYVPASNGRAMTRARDLACDAIIFDLEDAVAPAGKPAARDALVGELRQGGFGPRLRLVRVNGADTEWGPADLAALAGLPFDGLVLPKVGGPAAVARARQALGPVAVWAMMETPEAVMNAAAIAAAPGMAGLVLGTNDLAKDLGCRPRPDRLPLMFALQSCLMAARAAGILCLDGVFNAFGDEAGLAAECEQGRDLGFDGKTLIHPAQIGAANRIFAPSESELGLARRQIAAWEAAVALGRGVAVLDGRIVENLHVVAARAMLSRADAIAARAQ